MNPRTLTIEERERITAIARELYGKAARHFGCSDEPPGIRFDLRGRTAGQWRFRREEEVLRFNSVLFAATPDLHIPDTIAHEVAHCVVYRCHGHDVRPHGSQWRAVMAYLGCRPEVTHRTPPETLAQALDHPLYRCKCRNHALGPRQHRQAMAGRRRYRCRVCGEELVCQIGTD